jgi:UDP-N-acetylglucosamine 2-epimerase
MNVVVEWFDENKHIIIYRFEPRWNWQDLFTAIEEATVLLDEAEHTVDIILDVHKSPSIPNLNPVGLQKVANAPTAQHPNMGTFFMVGAKPYVKTMFDVFGRIYPKAVKQYKLVNSVEEAVQQITAGA